jgi:glycosyltransferase involved in cell wall biosynthesis
MCNENKRVWFVSKYAITPSYGNATRQYFISKYLSVKGLDVVLISSQSSNIKVYENLKGYFELKSDGNLKNFILKGPKISLGFSFLRLWSWVLFEWYVLKLALFSKQLKKPDVVIISSLSLLTFCSGVLLKWKYKAKLIIEVRDIWPLTLIEIGGYSKYNPLVLILRIIEKIGYSSSDAIVGTMPNLKEHINETIKKKKTVYCVPQGYDSNIFVNDLSDISKKKINNIRFDKFSIVYAGTIGSANNIDLILDTATELMIKGSKAHFYLVGDGPLKNNYVNQSANLDNVTFIEPVPPSELPQFLSNFDLLICPVKNQSIYRFGISFNKMVDYMRSGRPILFSYNGYPSFVDADKYSFTTAAEDSGLLTSKIIEIMGMNKQVLNRMGANGLVIVKNNHSFDLLSDKYIKIINSI